MELELKQQITDAVNDWIDEKNPARSAAKLAEKAGVNAAYVSRIKNGEYELSSGNGRITVINDTHFYKLADAIGIKLSDEFHWDFINSYKTGLRMLRRAQKKRLRVMLDGDSGQGKTFISRSFNRQFDYVVHIECSRNMTARALINTICNQLGIEVAASKSPFEKLELIKKVVSKGRGYALIFDQVGKMEVKPGIYGVLMDIAVAIEGRAAMVLSGYKIADMLESMHERQVPGYRQLARRFLANRLQLPSLNAADITAVCEHEGISNKGAVNVLIKYVRDLDQLTQWVRDILEYQEQAGKKITGEEVLSLFDINVMKAA